MQPTPYLFFRGTCRAAFTHYGEVFGTEPQLMSFDALPPEVAAGMPEMPTEGVMHGMVPVGAGQLYGSDDMTGDFVPMAGCNVSVELPDEAETRRVYAALSEGGEIRRPLAPEFWTPLYSAFTDRFGVRWMVMTEMSAG